MSAPTAKSNVKLMTWNIQGPQILFDISIHIWLGVFGGY